MPPQCKGHSGVGILFVFILETVCLSLPSCPINKTKASRMDPVEGPSEHSNVTQEQKQGDNTGVESQTCTDENLDKATAHPWTDTCVETPAQSQELIRLQNLVPDLPETSTQANNFLSDTVKVLSNYVNKEGTEAPYYIREELSQCMRRIAIMLTSAYPELKAAILSILSKSKDLLSLLALFIQQQFNAIVMRCVYIDFQDHPLMLAYSAVNACLQSSGPVIEAVMSTTIPQSIIEQLRMLKCFLDPKKEHIQIAALLFALTHNLLKLSKPAEEKCLIELGLLQVLPCYSSEILLAKFLIAHLYAQVPSYYHKFVVLSESEVSGLMKDLTSCVTSGASIIRMDIKGIGVTIDKAATIHYLRECLQHPINLKAFQNSKFVELLTLLLDDCDSKTITSLLQLLGSICFNHSVTQMIQTKFPQLLLKLEEHAFHSDEEVQCLAASVIQTILSNGFVEGATSDSSMFSDDLLTQFKYFIDELCKHLLPASETIVNIHDIHLKCLLGNVISMLQLLLKLDEEQSKVVVSQSSSELEKLLLLLCDYTSWMLCNILGDKEQNYLIPTHIHAMFHFTFYLLACVCNESVELLNNTGVLKLIADELVAFTQLLKWDGDIRWFVCICLSTLFESSLKATHSPEGINATLNDALASLCVHEDFEYSFPSRLLYSISPGAKEQSQLLKLTAHETKSLLQGLLHSAVPKFKRVKFKGPKGGPTISLSFDQLMMFLIRLVKMNSDNCICFIEADPVPALVTLVISEESSIIRKKVIELILEVVQNSRHHKYKVLEHLEGFLQIINVEMETEGSEHCKPAVATTEFSSFNCLPNGLDGEQIIHQIIYSIRHVLSTQSEDIEDYLAETFVRATKEIHYAPFAEKDRLCLELLLLMDIVDSPGGRSLFLSHILASSLPLLKIFCAFLDKCFTKILECNDKKIIPVTTLLRTERVLIIFYGVCQHSDEFCQELAKAGGIQYLSTFLYTYNALGSYAFISEVTQRLPELALFLVAVCANAEGCEGYFSHSKCVEIVKSFCSGTSTTTKLLAKCALSCLARFEDVNQEHYQLHHSEVEVLFLLMSDAVKDKDGESNVWPVYTLTTPHYLHCLLSLCSCLLFNHQNAKLLLEGTFLVDNSSVTMLGILNSAFQSRHDHPLLLKRALYFLEKLSLILYPNVTIEVEKNYPQLVTRIESLFCESMGSLQLSAFFCLQSLGHKTSNITGIPDSLLKRTAFLRTEQYISCMESHKDVLENEEIKFHAMKLFGEASFRSYYQKRLSQAESSPLAATCLEHAQQAVKFLGAAYDNKLIKDGDLEVEMLDIALIDLILGVTERKTPQVRCLLCRKRCQKGEKLISSHIWADCFLQHFAESSQAPPSKKIFDNISKLYGMLQSPRQISYPMLCKKCEDQFSQYEKAFKSNFFDPVYNDPEYAYNPEEITVQLRKKAGNGEGGDWLYPFCLSMIFRALGLAVYGSIRFCGNAKEVYRLFASCRTLLLETTSLKNTEITKPQIAVFFTPIHMLMIDEAKMSPALKSIVFSTAMSTISEFSLRDGKRLPQGKVEYILCSIGAINIIAAVDSFHDIQPDCLVKPCQSQFIIPSAFRRYLTFPKGLMKTFEFLATIKAKRVLNAPHTAFAHQDHLWRAAELESYLSSEIENVTLQSFDISQGKGTRMNINLLPSPYTGIRMPVDVKDIALPSVAIHSISMLDDDALHKSMMVLKQTLSGDREDSLFALLNIDTNLYNVWNGYILSSENGISIQEPLREKKVDVKVFQKVEEVFNTRHVLERQLNIALKKVGFISTTQFALWINCCWNGEESTVCDMRCETAGCNFCSGLCNTCMKPATLSHQLENSHSVAQFCSDKCASYLLSEEPMPTETHAPKTESRIILSLCSNGVTFGMGKGKVFVYVLKSDKPDTFLILYQVRRAYQQKIQVFYSSIDFQSIQLREETLDKEKVVEEIKQSKLLGILDKMLSNQSRDTPCYQLDEQESESKGTSKDRETPDPESDESLSLDLLDF